MREIKKHSYSRTRKLCPYFLHVAVGGMECTYCDFNYGKVKGKDAILCTKDEHGYGGFAIEYRLKNYSANKFLLIEKGWVENI
jgi:hypothetical protein